jgi:PST family polysaccharide transporter
MTVSSSLPASPATPAGRRTGTSATALRNLLWLGSDKLISVMLGLLVFGLIARHYGPSGAGQFSYGVALLQTALGLSLVCSSAAVLPRLCQLRDGTAASTVANVFVVRMVASLTAAAVVAVYAVLAIDDPARRLVTLVMVATVPLLEPFQAFSAYWLSRNQNRVPVVARGSGLLARLAVVAVALWAGAPTWVVALAWVMEAIVSATLQSASLRAVRPLRRLFNAVRSPRVAPYFKFGVRFTIGLWLSHLFLRMDRLWLAERMDPHEFGLYGTAMQLVEVWLQAATLLAGSMAPAFLYRAVRHSTRLRDHWRTLLLLGSLGVAGLLAAHLVGPWLLTQVFGTPFAASAGYLVAGFAAAVLFFLDQFVQISITANNRPGLLAAKWAGAAVAALATLIIATPRIGAYAGPLGIALGLATGWVVTRLGRGVRMGGGKER